jgi:hypothetical protein
MAVPSEKRPTESQDANAEYRSERHLAGLGAFRPVTSWVAVVLALIAVVGLIYMMSRYP